MKKAEEVNFTGNTCARKDRGFWGIVGDPREVRHALLSEELLLHGGRGGKPAHPSDYIRLLLHLSKAITCT